MATKLVELFRKNPERVRQLDTLMHNCRSGQCRRIHVVTVGSGDAFITRYWPTLWKYVNRGLVVLTVADQEPLESLAQRKIALAKTAPDEGKAAQKLEARYNDLLRKVRQPSVGSLKTVKYVDLGNPQEREWYEHIQADIVFVLVPDDAHIQEARPWNERATIVFIEKPYNRNLVEAQQFVEEIEELVSSGGDAAYTFFFGLDHYFAKIFDYVLKRGDRILENRIGHISQIEFLIAEAGGVEPWRASTLEAGIVYDLLPHVMAMISPIIKLASFPLDVRKLHLRVARHRGCPFGAESYAWLKTEEAEDYLGRRVVISGHLAKGAGIQDDKYLRLIGERGDVYFELNPEREGLISLKEKGVEYTDPIFEVKKGHPEILEALLSGRFMEEPIGGIPGDEAVQILEILTAIRTRVERMKGRMPEYEIGEEIEKIWKEATLV